MLPTTFYGNQKQPLNDFHNSGQIIAFEAQLDVHYPALCFLSVGTTAPLSRAA